MNAVRLLQQRLLLFIGLLIVPFSQLSSQIIETIAGTGAIGFSGDGGPAIAADFYGPQGIYIDKNGIIFLTDYRNCAVRKITPDGIVTTIAGTGYVDYTGDGGPATAATFFAPEQIIGDNSGNLYIVDKQNHAIRRIDAATGIITTIAGTGVPGFSGDGGPAVNARLNSPLGIAIDKTGKIYIADCENHIIRMINKQGIINTIAGMPKTRGYSGDGGPASAARFYKPKDIQFDDAGNLFVNDNFNNVIRKIATTGIITTIVGTGAVSTTGDGGPAINATINFPSGMKTDKAGNLFFSEAGGNVVRKVDLTTGIITRIAGKGSAGYSGDNTPAICAELHKPICLAFDKDENLYIADAGNNVVRKIVQGPGAQIIRQPVNITMCSSENASFAIRSTSFSTSYQWQVDDGTGYQSVTDNMYYEGSKTDSLVIKRPTPGMNNYRFRCITGNACVTVTSVEVTLTVTPLDASLVSVSILASTNNICSGSPVTFQAVASNAGPSPVYVWKLNNTAVGTNSNSFTSSTLSDGDNITCIVTSNSSCSMGLRDTSDGIKMIVYPWLTPAISISSSQDNICPGTNVVFNAKPLNGGSTPSYRWQVNGIDAGTNNATFSTSTLRNNDIVSCILTSSEGCITAASAISGQINMQVVDPVKPSISIQSSHNSICAGDQVSFTATAFAGGTSPMYQWQVNGRNVGTNAPTYTSANLYDKDIVNCILTSNAPCTSPVPVMNVISMTVRPLPNITMEQEKVVRLGESVPLNPFVSGNIASYTWGPSATLNDAGTKNPVASPLSTTVYKLKVSTVEGCRAEATITITVFTDLLMPTAFSPNGDGKNDYYRIPPSMQLGIDYFAIYNRYGSLVFKTTSGSTSWDGTYLNVQQPVGTYVWIVKHTDPQTGQSKIKKGSLVLTR